MPGNPQTSSPSSRLRIADIVVDLGTHEVSRDGVRIPLPKLTYQLLLVLAEAAPNLLTNDQLVERLWPGQIVTPETLTQRIRLLRQALGDDAQEPKYIGGLRGQGYRILPPVERLEGDDPVAPARTHRYPVAAVWLAVTALAALGLVLAVLWPGSIENPGDEPVLPPNSLAVLPFANSSKLAEDEHLGGAIADELRGQLGRVPGLKVSARVSSWAFRDNAPDARSMARRLGVRWLVEGVLHRDERRVLVSLQVVDGETGFTALSRRFDFGAAGLPTAQDEMVRNIVDLVATGIEPVNSAEPISGPITGVVSAYELMLVARQLEQRVRDYAPSIDEENLDRAIDLYNEVTRLDPNSALAFSYLAGALLYRGNLDQAEIAIRHAQRIEPDLSEVQYTLGLYFWARQDARAGDAFQRAVDINPNNVDALWELAKWQWHQMRSDVAGDLMQRGLELDPLSLSRHADMGNYFGVAGYRKEALEVAKRIELLFPSVDGYLALGRIHEVTGDLDEAIAWVMKALGEQPNRQDIGWQLAELYARIGDATKALAYEPEPGVGHLFFTRHYAELIDLAEERILEYPDELKLYYALGFAYAVEGQAERAVYVLRRAGLPDSALNESRKADAVEALVTLADAMDLVDEQPDAIGHAGVLIGWFESFRDTGAHHSWWPSLYGACAYLIAGKREAGLANLELINQSPGLVWYPVLKDAPCFRSVRDEPRYQRVLAGVESRMAQLRDKVPSTLARHGLVEAHRLPDSALQSKP
ncbi:MAG TPA: winged helix-turn-helix domain-containing protein [Xanthomonadales bacterium]|nr:winged helix-turn-helix domain-containing protein [Xanthomonadales bacterium]